MIFCALVIFHFNSIPVLLVFFEDYKCNSGSWVLPQHTFSTCFSSSVIVSKYRKNVFVNVVPTKPHQKLLRWWEAFELSLFIPTCDAAVVKKLVWIPIWIKIFRFFWIIISIIKRCKLVTFWSYVIIRSLKNPGTAQVRAARTGQRTVELEKNGTFIC